jgi:hypothetical protein
MLEAGANATSWHIDCSRPFEPELFAIWATASVRLENALIG